ncbi:hypothetical protein D5W64_13135 [Salmonella enterica subsp. enterica serovar Saintpaul]|nr:hypothetical protein [Salmonella enterica subsp. enterica serovar Saintpaul]
MELFAINLRFPNVHDVRVLQVVGAGLMFLFDNHKTLGTDLDDELQVDQAKFTMGDHCADLVWDDQEFEVVYNAAVGCLTEALVCHTEALNCFATQIDGISDIFSMEYPGVLKLYVKEGNPAYATLGYSIFHFLE